MEGYSVEDNSEGYEALATICLLLCKGDFEPAQNLHFSEGIGTDAFLFKKYTKNAPFFKKLGLGKNDTFHFFEKS